MLFYLLIIVLAVVGMWKLFEKAGYPGWAAIIPIYNVIVMLQISGKPVWWFIFYLIPVANIIAHLLVSLELAKKFGKGTGFAIGLWLLPFIFMMILGYGSSTYDGSGDQRRGRW